jgi:hypothetical protein
MEWNHRKFSQKEEIQNCAFGRKCHGGSFLGLGRTYVCGHHEKRNRH